MPTPDCSSQLDNGLFSGSDDPLFGLNLQGLLANESLQRAYDAPWWYRLEFAGAGGAASQGCAGTITLKGINYRAEVWFNGKVRLHEPRTWPNIHLGSSLCAPSFPPSLQHPLTPHPPYPLHLSPRRDRKLRIGVETLQPQPPAPFATLTLTSRCVTRTSWP